ncbi:unnamed protein product, partial [Brachionus calyciflorus]
MNLLRLKDEYDSYGQQAIKNNSPFTKLFIDIESEIRCEINLQEDLNMKQNEYFCPDFIKFIQNEFIPNAFIRVSFSLKGISNQPSRLTNGLVEGKIKSRKNCVKAQSLSRLNPAQYATFVNRIVPGQVKQYFDFQKEIDKHLDSVENLNESYYVTLKDYNIYESSDDRASDGKLVREINSTNSLIKQKKNNNELNEDDYADQTDLDLSQELETSLKKSDSEKIEYNFAEATENWNKKPVPRKMVKNEGFFQQSCSINFLGKTDNSEKSIKKRGEKSGKENIFKKQKISLDIDNFIIYKIDSFNISQSMIRNLISSSSIHDE